MAKQQANTEGVKPKKAAKPAAKSATAARSLADIDTTGMTPEQVADLAEQTAGAGKRKPRNKVSPKTQKVPEIAAKHPGNVKSGGKQAGADDVRPPGRPSEYTQEVADRICAALAEGKSMRTVCLADDMPAMSTVFKWLRERNEFSEQYTKAKTEAADAMVEEMIDIADDGRNDWMEAHDKDGESVGYKVNGDHIQRSRLRVETRKWIAAKLKPKKYGDKVDLNHGVQPDNPLASLLAQINGSALPVAQDDKGE